MRYRFRAFPQGLREHFIGRRSGSHLETIDAVKDVSLDICEGDAVGVIGSNGSGKSSLLRALAGLQPLLSGEVRAVEQPILLGVSSVLKPAISGRRNIWLGCLALGLTPKDIRALETDIISFAELGNAIDRPMRTYSSGMRARLHFAIATSVRPRILILDETLAVGDESFRRRSAERLEQVRADSGAILLVTHSLPEVERSATRVLWLNDGMVQLEGEPQTVTIAYRKYHEKHE